MPYIIFQWTLDFFFGVTCVETMYTCVKAYGVFAYASTTGQCSQVGTQPCIHVLKHNYYYGVFAISLHHRPVLVDRCAQPCVHVLEQCGNMSRQRANLPTLLPIPQLNISESSDMPFYVFNVCERPMAFLSCFFLEFCYPRGLFISHQDQQHLCRVLGSLTQSPSFGVKSCWVYAPLPGHTHHTLVSHLMSGALPHILFCFFFSAVVLNIHEGSPSLAVVVCGWQELLPVVCLRTSWCSGLWRKNLVN